ncbi:hypothetical protein Bbelb_373670 [Branchiostoma belcheri]|nr:hypothetical protein Bbelb_373670 [Branchiostoma belcheri]
MAESGDRTLEKITFHGRGSFGYGVAVSADYEIFVTDYFPSKALHVFSMNGTYLRTFPTVLPGENGAVDILPRDVAIGVEPGYLWVAGRINGEANNGYIDVVQYSRNGAPIKAFKIRFVEPCFHAVIAVDVCNNKIIVGSRDTVTMIHPNGSVYRSFNAPVTIGGITSDSEGNILITNGKTVMVYSHSGDKLFDFGSTVRRGTCGLYTGICLDTLGRIIVVNINDSRIDMFTRRGEFVRTMRKEANEDIAKIDECLNQLLMSTSMRNLVEDSGSVVEDSGSVCSEELLPVVIVSTDDSQTDPLAIQSNSQLTVHLYRQSDDSQSTEQNQFKLCQHADHGESAWHQRDNHYQVVHGEKTSCCLADHAQNWSYKPPRFKCGSCDETLLMKFHLETDSEGKMMRRRGTPKSPCLSAAPKSTSMIIPGRTIPQE